MKIVRILIAGVTVTIFNSLIGMLTCGYLFIWVYEIEPTNIWRQIDAAPPPEYFIGALIVNILLATVYAVLCKGIPGKKKLVKGLIFGLCVWAVGMLPGMLSTYMFMTVAATVVIYWLVLRLVTIPLSGLIIAAIYGQ